MKVIIALLILIGTTQCLGPVSSSKTPEDYAYYVHGMRGFWEGYMQGLYNSPSPRHITDYCLNEEIAKKLYNLAYIINEEDYLSFFQVFQDTMTIVANIDECGLELSIEELV